MASVNLPYPEQGRNDKETIQILYDTVLKLRKELSFALMNIDVDNSPALEGVVAQSNDNSATIQVLNGEIDLSVKKDGVISAINLSTEGIKISADKINITGLVTFTDLSTEGQTIINGANITTGTIDADRVATNIAKVNLLLYIGDEDSTATKEIRFASGARIRGGSNGVAPWFTISAADIKLDGPVTIMGDGVATTLSSQDVKFQVYNGSLEFSLNGGLFTKLANG